VRVQVPSDGGYSIHVSVHLVHVSVRLTYEVCTAAQSVREIRYLDLLGP